MTVLVSVCIPVYGVEKYIERCARSLFEQTLDSLEYIFVDDCSPDNSITVMQKVLEEYPQRKDQVKVIRHEVNQGVGAARNHGVAACTGDYIIHCDPDDWVDVNMYEAMYNKAIETDADMVCCPYIEEYSEQKKKVVNITNNNTVNEFIKSNLGGKFNSLCNKLYKKEIAQVLPIVCPDRIIMGEDLLRNVQMITKCSEIAFCNNVYYHYFRGNLAASTRNFNRKHLDQLIGLTSIIEKLSLNIFPEFYSSLKAQVLFATLKTKEFSTTEFKNLYPKKSYRNIIKTSLLPLWKKLLLLIAIISYPLAKYICSFLIKIKFQ